jgi:hypothetical protein
MTLRLKVTLITTIGLMTTTTKKLTTIPALLPGLLLILLKTKCELVSIRGLYVQH